MHALEAEDIRKTFGSFAALRGITLSLARGEFLALFGGNGAGKTTFLKTVAMLLRPTHGRIAVEGFDIRDQAAQARRSLGFLSHNTYLYRDLTPIENLRLFAGLYSVPDADARIERLIERVGLKNRSHDPVRSFSRGLQQRLGLARALLHSPALVLLDEPYTGLDANAADILDSLLDELKCDGRTIVMTSHDLDQGLRAATRAIVIDKGRVVLSSVASDPEVRTAYARFVRREALS